MPKTLDLTNRVYERLTVVRRGGRNSCGHNLWVCTCSCSPSVEFEVAVGHLQSGHTISCGCLQKERAAESCKIKQTKHGFTNDPIFDAWHNARIRCADLQDEDYGGRGIRVYPEWQDDFDAFSDYVLINMGARPEGHSLDRIDNSRNYEPGNIRWATKTQQARNRRNNILYTLHGRTQCLSAWAEEYRIPYQVVWKRMRRKGKAWTLEEALTTPPNPKHNANKVYS